MNQRHRFYTYRENKNGETVRVRCGKNSGYPVWCDYDICAEEEQQEYKKRAEAELTTPPLGLSGYLLVKPIMGSSGKVQIGEVIEYNLVPQADGDNPLEKIMEQKRFEETDVERLAKFIAQKESRNCKTIDEAIHHQSKWQRIVPEAREMLESALVSVQDLSLHLQGKCTDHIWLMEDGPEPHTLGIRMDCGDSGVVYLTHEQAADLADQLKSMLEVKGPDNKPN